MCIACGFPTASGDWTNAGSLAEAEASRDRAQTITVLAGVLAFYGLKARSMASTGGITISTPSGRYVNTRSVDDAWSAAAQLLGRPLDPLDPSFIRSFGERGE